MKKYSYESVFKILKKEIPIKRNNFFWGIKFVADPSTGKSYVSNLTSKKKRFIYYSQ